MIKFGTTTINSIKLGGEEDTVKCILGSDWSMPTYNQMVELHLQCKWTLTTLNGVFGYKVTSKKNDNYIFIPIAGYMEGTQVLSKNVIGRYYTSTYKPLSSTYVYSLKLDSSTVDVNDTSKYCGYSIRPVSSTYGVDLGLSVKWSATNLTATGLAQNPEDAGDYFAWKENKPKTEYTEATYSNKDISRVYIGDTRISF